MENKKNVEQKEKYDFNDILLEPSIITNINSRKSVNSYDEHGKSPIFTSPMTDVVGIDNIGVFLDNKIHPILPRTRNYELNPNLLSSHFNAMSLSEFKELFCEKDISKQSISIQYLRLTSTFAYVLIDMANGHMKSLIDAIKQSKEIYGDKLILMVGNIANPNTYVDLSRAGADYCRCGIGGGSVCLTSVQTGIGYPMASLIRETYKLKEKCIMDGIKPAKIIADGGIKNYSDAIKSLALGADYVLLGGLLNKSLESSGDTYLWKIIKINQHSRFAKWLFAHNFKLYKRYRGMSTKSIQKQMGNNVLKTSEGVIKHNLVEYELSTWVENFQDYLCSAMSYCGASTLEEFIGKARYNIITKNAFDRFNK